MANIGLIRCEKNQDRCPLTSCFISLRDNKEAFARHEDGNTLVGVFTCHCPGDTAVNMAKILKSKGADVVHFSTCVFAGKQDGAWIAGRGFCDAAEELCSRVAREANIPCVLGSAHLPAGHTPKTFGG